MKKRIVSALLAVVMVLALLPGEALAAGTYPDYHYRIAVQTGDVGLAAPGWTIYISFEVYQNNGTTIWVERTYPYNHSFDQGYLANMDIVIDYPPWLIKTVKLDGGDNSWYIDYVEIYGMNDVNRPGSPGLYMSGFSFNRWVSEKDRAVCNIDKKLVQRNLIHIGNFDTFVGDRFLDAGSNRQEAFAYDRMVTDQYGTYNSSTQTVGWGQGHVTCSLEPAQMHKHFKSAITGRNNGEIDVYTVNERALYNAMVAENMDHVQVNHRLDFGEGVNADNRSFIRTIHYYRKTFGLGTPDISTSQTFVPRRDVQYFNQEKNQVIIRVSPQYIHGQLANLEERTQLVGGFWCTAGLYAGNSTAENQRLCDMQMTKQGDQLVFTGTLPEGADTKGAGLTLSLTGAGSSRPGLGDYQMRSPQGFGNLTYYFSSHRVDLVSPTVTLVNRENQPVDIKNKVSKEQTFYMVGSETLYCDKNVAHDSGSDGNEKYAKYELVAANGGVVPMSGYGLQRKVGIDTSPLDAAQINLGLGDAGEGKYQLRVYAYDDADNVTLGAGGRNSPNYTEFEEIYLDNLAPRASLTPIPQNQAPDGTKRTDFAFGLNDLCLNSPDRNAWARVYYCFVPDGTTRPKPDESTITSGELDSVLNQWAFIGSASGTAILRVARGQSFSGRLDYYTLDSAGNRSGMSSQRITMKNTDSADTLLSTGRYGGSPKPSFSIAFQPNENLKTEWHWTSRDDTTFRQDYRTYTQGMDVGAAQQQVSGGTKTMHGNYTLEYKVTALDSGNYKIYTEDYTFDNTPPAFTKQQWSTTPAKALTNQQLTLQASDLAGIASASYQVVNPDGSAIEGAGPVGLTPKPISSGSAINWVDESPSFSRESGVYSLWLKATDQNGQTTEVKYPQALQFALRTLAPSISAFTHSLGAENRTNQTDYSVTASVTEPMKNAGFLTTPQVVKYRISADGVSYGPWTVAAGTMQANGDNLTHSFTLETPVALKEGSNRVFIQTACANQGDSAAPTLTSDTKSLAMTYDATPPTFEPVRYNTTSPTKSSVVATLQVGDAGVGLGALTCENAAVAVQNNGSGSYTLTIPHDLETHAVVKDLLGNCTIIPIKVSCIDQAAPVVKITKAEQITSGARSDAVLTLTITDRNPGNTRFALAEHANETLEEKHYSAFTGANGFQTTQSEPLPSGDGQYTTTYTIRARGLSGSFALGIAATDALGNQTVVVPPEGVFTLTDVAAGITGNTCSPIVTKSTTTATVGFHVPVAVVPEKTGDGSATIALWDTSHDESLTEEVRAAAAQKLEEFLATLSSAQYSMTCQRVCSSKEPVPLLVRDECGRISKLDFIPAAQFVDGFKIETSIFHNGQPAENGTMLSLVGEDTLQLVVEPGETDPQVFYVDKAVYDGFTLNEAQSILKQAPAVPDPAADPAVPAAYTKLVFDAIRDGKTEKTVKLQSYTELGLEKDRLQEEYIAVRTVDETAPVTAVTYSSTGPTNQNVTAVLTVSDPQTGIGKVERKLGDGAYEVLTGGTATYQTEFEENGSATYRVTNGAGITSEAPVAVGNIDKAPIAENTHYKVEYHYRNYKDQWTTALAGGAYRAVRASLVPVSASGKTIEVSNNNGSKEVLLTKENQSFTFRLADAAGNVAEQAVTWADYDLLPGTIRWTLSNTKKTNQPVNAEVIIADADRQNAIAHAEVRDAEGAVCNWAGPAVGDVYMVSLPNSGLYTVKAWDVAGNSWSQVMTVTNINKELPKIKTLKYSIAPGVVTAQSVRVDMIEFTKPNVKVMSVTAEAPLTAGDIDYVPGSNAVRFKKNGNVTVALKDDYGNEDKSNIAVSNIYDQPPALEAVAKLAGDQLSMEVSFRPQLDENNVPVDIFRKLADLSVSYRSAVYKADKANFILKNNGSYRFSVFDVAGNTQFIDLEVTGIDDVAPKITQVTWAYDYQVPTEGQPEAWTTQRHEKTLVIGTDTSGKEAGYAIAPDKYPVTNSDVTVTVVTDKATAPVGDKTAPALEANMIYSANGMYIFHQQAPNGTTASYGVDVEVIDKTPPVLQLAQGPELVFIEGMTADKNPEFVYDSAKLLDYAAYDEGPNHTRVNLTDKVIIDYGTFHHTDISQNEFDRTQPYYINYKVYDAAGNSTTVRRTIRLVGFYDTIALVNGNMPNSTNTASVTGSNIDISLKNFSGTAFVRYEKGSYTMGQMKTKGNTLVERGGVYNIPNVTEGWYTVYIQTDKRDYFNITIYVGKPTK